jgi:hypothetical protein
VLVLVSVSPSAQALAKLLAQESEQESAEQLALV